MAQKNSIKKRKLFDELMVGVESMQHEREGKITLHTHNVEKLPPLHKNCNRDG